VLCRPGLASVPTNGAFDIFPGALERVIPFRAVSDLVQRANGKCLITQDAASNPPP